MKYIPGHTFVAKRRVTEPFVVGAHYRIYHIAPTNEKNMQYIFTSPKGNLTLYFESTNIADSIIDRVST